MKRITACLGTVLWATQALAAGYSEKTTGDLSDHSRRPDTVALAPGQNVIAGRFGLKAGKAEPDRDYFTITLAEGQTLDAIFLDPKTDVGGAFSFIGVQAGSRVTVPPDGSSAQDLLGWAHFGSGDEGRDILPAIGAGSGAIGFTPPLTAGTYSFWLQELAQCRCKYRFVFVMGDQQ